MFRYGYEATFTTHYAPRNAQLQIIKYAEKKQQHTWKTRAVATLARSHMRDLQSFKKS